MTTKGKHFVPGNCDPYHETAEKIDFPELDNFVSMLINAYVSNRGRETVAQDLYLIHYPILPYFSPTDRRGHCSVPVAE